MTKAAENALAAPESQATRLNDRMRDLLADNATLRALLAAQQREVKHLTETCAKLREERDALAANLALTKRGIA